MGPKKRRVREESDDSAYEADSTYESDSAEGSDNAERTVNVTADDLTGKSFATWTEFEKQFAAYSTATFQSYVRRSSTTRTARNKRIADAFAATHEEEVPKSKLYLDESFKYYLVVFECIHAGKHRNRGNGKRPRLTVRSIECPAKREGDRYFYQVSRHIAQHNHALGRESFKSLPKQRMALPEEKIATVDLFRKLGRSRKKILKYFWDHTDCEPVMGDIHNLMAKLEREEDADTTLSDRVSETQDRFCEKETFGVAHVDIDREDDKLVVRCISLQTSHMRSLFSAFPEVMLVDATHDTNTSGYKLFSFMVHDTFGHGQYVQHALMTDERAETLKLALRQFKKCNPAWRNVRCIVVDKDFTEIGVFASEMPDARILLCQFHAIKYLQERISKTEYGLDAVQRERLKPVVSLIVRAQTEEEYVKCYDYMKQELRFRRMTKNVTKVMFQRFGVTFWQIGTNAEQCGPPICAIMSSTWEIPLIIALSRLGKRLRRL